MDLNHPKLGTIMSIVFDFQRMIFTPRISTCTHTERIAGENGFPVVSSVRGLCLRICRSLLFPCDFKDSSRRFASFDTWKQDKLLSNKCWFHGVFSCWMNNKQITPKKTKENTFTHTHSNTFFTLRNSSSTEFGPFSSVLLFHRENDGYFWGEYPVAVCSVNVPPYSP